VQCRLGRGKWNGGGLGRIRWEEMYFSTRYFKHRSAIHRQPFRFNRLLSSFGNKPDVNAVSVIPVIQESINFKYLERSILPTSTGRLRERILITLHETLEITNRL
jgi:hypothetical protein